MHPIGRRTFLKSATVAAAAAVCLPRTLLAMERRAQVIVVHGKDIGRMLAEGVSRLGGWAAFVKKGAKVALKPNAAWASAPVEGGNTLPELVTECIAACRSAGAARVNLPENPCSPSAVSFPMSGIAAAAKKAGGRLYQPTGKDFRAVTLPGAKTLKKADVPADVLDADCLINMPVAKSHGGATLTLSMKNWMGSVKDRGFWHRSGLHQCIADFSTFVKPSLIVVDAMRTMLTNGPRGPGKLAHPEQIILGTDPVAVDAYAATLFKMEPFDVEHIRLAHEMGVGCGDLAQVDVVHVNA
ncbi:MAG: DUF362 domain-containing protein [Kiritimatiellae bacterium]|nr:DUF362 domain-containing protein [Kiritimatiellia bacterium]